MPSESLSLYLVGAFLTALFAALAGTWIVRRWAIRRGHLDVPDDERRIHSLPTPNVGGMAIALTATATFVAWSFWIVPGEVVRPEILAMLLGGLLMFGVGFWDDTQHVSAFKKFGLQLVIAGGAFFGGVQILGISFGSIWQGEFSGVLSFAITTAWIVGTTNAFNLIDGSDGVAAGAALFASASLGVIFALNADPLGALMATILVGACLGFLFFNFPPASIFMGDSGSLFLGYTLASLGVITTQKSSTLIAVTIPVIAFGLPLLDTSIAIIRRFLRRQPIFMPDRGHIHHRLRDLGHSPRTVAILIYVACAGFASLSLLVAAPGRPTVLPVFVVAAAVLVIGVQRLRVPELAELSRLVGRGLQQRLVISHNVQMHTATEALLDAADGDAIVTALEMAFSGSEFSRFELWVPKSLAGPLLNSGNALVRSDVTGCEVSKTYERLINAELEVEFTFPVYENAKRVGRFSLFRSSDGDRLYSDMRIVARQLVPALVRALTRLASAAPRSASSSALSS